MLKWKAPLEVLGHHLAVIVDEALSVDGLRQLLTKVRVLEMELELEVPVVFCEDLNEVLVALIVVVVVLLKI